MSGFVGLWVDDERPLPENLQQKGWCKATSFHEAVTKLDLLEFQEISLDHDLGCFYGSKEMTGYEILMWLVERKQNDLYVPPVIYVHSANPVGRRRMEETIKQYWVDISR